MFFSRNKSTKTKNAESKGDSEDSKGISSLEDYLQARDYNGAMTLVEFKKNSGKKSVENELWLAYCAFHLADYKTATEVYEGIVKGSKFDNSVWVSLACCLFMLGLYKEAEQTAKKGPKSALQNRLLFHLSHKLSDENRLKQLHSTLGESVEDQLSLASIHYLRNHYQEAIDIYKRLLINNREYHALNVYIALCYYKLDYYDVSEEVLSSYLSQHADSATAINLKACNLFKIFNGKAAEIELKTLEDLSTPSFTYAKDLVKHNLTVFRNGQGCLQVLPSQVDVIPEARLNLVIYYLKQDELTEAEELMKDVESSTSQEYILKAIVHACIGQQNNSKENITKALQLFNVVGSSSSECDTIPGRQCMASTFLLRKQFEEAMVYLNSIKSYFHNNDTFNFNYGQAKASLSQFKEAEEAFLLIQSDKIKAEYTYLSWLTRCFIMNKKPRLAWELYLKMDTCTDSYNLLLLIANDCYKIGLFFYSAKAFDVLERLDSNPEFWEGKRGACMGAFQLIVSGQEPKESLRDIGQMLQNTGNPQVEYILRIMNKWAKENRLPFYN